MTIWTILLFILGFIIIVKSGDWFVEAAVWVAEKTGVPKMLIGATIVSFATTLPEFFVSVIAVSNGANGLGIGNAIGSVICNTGLILALSITVKPSTVEHELFFKKAAIMFISLVILFLASLDKVISAWEGIPLFGMLVIFIYLNVHHAKKGILSRQKEITHIDTHEKKTGINILKFVAGATGIVIGADLLVKTGTAIASSLGVSDGIIGVTVIALGTSLPEFVTTVTAIRKKHISMGIGNILGANILNITMILATCALVSGGGLNIGSDYLPVLSRVMPRSIYIDMPVAALLFLILIIPPLLFKGKLKRFQGIAMMAVYAAFIVFLILNI
ncbi:MAG: calcium/sodium antiporter [Eubacteriales bacterium]|nr:calcium/sodium antiporter [Eubacteriales bacterium]